MKTKDILGGIFIVVTERDHTDPIKSRGAIAMETHTGNADLLQTIKRAKIYEDNYGEPTIFKLEKVGTLEECEKIISEAKK